MVLPGPGWLVYVSMASRFLVEVTLRMRFLDIGRLRREYVERLRRMDVDRLEGLLRREP